MTQELPDSYELVDGINERVQELDKVYDEEDAEWYDATRWHVGHYVSEFPAVARLSLANTKPLKPKAPRIRRPRPPKE